MSEIDLLAKTVGKNLKAMRKRAYPADTQSQSAARLGISRATYSRMERGDARVSFKHYLQAARLFQCEKQVAQLFTRQDTPAGLIDELLRAHHGKK